MRDLALWPVDFRSAASLFLVAEIIERFPLFPLGLVLLPREVVPLHIFEERYKLMIGECLDAGREFGILWLADDGLKEIGCSAEITEVLERTEDGRMNILVQGTRPLRLLRRLDDLDYPAGDIELLDEDPPGEDPDAGGKARATYAELVEKVTDSRPSESDLGELDAYGMAATLDFALEAKQDLLEQRSEAERLESLAELFSATLRRLEHSERAAERAQGNGKVRFEGV